MSKFEIGEPTRMMFEDQGPMQVRYHTITTTIKPDGKETYYGGSERYVPPNPPDKFLLEICAAVHNGAHNLEGTFVGPVAQLVEGATNLALPRQLRE